VNEYFLICFKLFGHYNGMTVQSGVIVEQVIVDLLVEEGGGIDNEWYRFEVSTHGDPTVRVIEVCSNGKGHPRFWREFRPASTETIRAYAA